MTCVNNQGATEIVFAKWLDLVRAGFKVHNNSYHGILKTADTVYTGMDLLSFYKNLIL